MKRYIFVLTLLAGLSSTVALAGSKSVGLVMTYDPKEVSIPSIELYRQIVSDAEKSGEFVVVPMSVTRKNMPSPKSKSYGALPVFDRRYLLRAHPPARSFTKPHERHRQEARRMIAPVQSMVDTLAIDGALIVDCSAKKSGSVLVGCSLLFYERSRGQITGAVSKRFRVGINDATRWSHILVADLASGMSSERNRREKDRIRQALGKPVRQGRKSLYMAEVQVGGQNAASTDVSFGPALGVWIGKRVDDFSFGFVGSVGSSSATNGAVTTEFEERSYGVGFGVGTRAMENVEWDLGLALAISDRSLNRGVGEGDLAAASFSQTNRDVRLTLAPGLLWRLNRTTAWGMGVTGNKYFGLKSDVSTDEGSLLETSGIGMNLRLRATF